MKLVIGTRGSALALWQARHIRDRLLAETDADDVTLEVISTKGDRIQNVSLAKVGGKGLFVKEIEAALYEKTIDLAVHSMKDMPSELPPGLVIGAVPERANPLDAWVARAGDSDAQMLSKLPHGSVVGTSSLRRAAQLLAERPDVTILPIRGNVDTRLAKLDEGVDGLRAIILACAGLERLGWSERITEAIPSRGMLPAVGQGALAIECREGDERVLGVLAHLDHTATRRAVEAERAFLRTVEGSCQIPVGGFAEIDEAQDLLTLRTLLAAPDGTTILSDERAGPVSSAVALGQAAGESLLAQGGRELLDALLGHDG